MELNCGSSFFVLWHGRYEYMHPKTRQGDGSRVSDALPDDVSVAVASVSGVNVGPLACASVQRGYTSARSGNVGIVSTK